MISYQCLLKDFLPDYVKYLFPLVGIVGMMKISKKLDQ